jgi:hypothetical protein
MTAATGEPPLYQAGAWVWEVPQHQIATAYPTVAVILACTADSPTNGIATVEATASCILHRSNG